MHTDYDVTHNFGFEARRGENMKKVRGGPVKATTFIIGERKMLMA
jgi:hypothetical protein